MLWFMGHKESDTTERLNTTETPCVTTNVTPTVLLHFDFLHLVVTHTPPTSVTVTADTPALYAPCWGVASLCYPHHSPQGNYSLASESLICKMVLK